MVENPKPKKGKRLSDMDRPLIYNESLMEIFDFDDHALRTNQGGFATNRQKQVINDELKEEADSMWLMLTIFLGVSVLLAVIFTLQGYSAMPLVIGVGLIIGIMMAIGYRRQTKLKDDVNRLRTVRLDGLPEVRNTLSGDKQAILMIDGEKLPITYRQAAALSEFALPYMSVYYAANSKQILSAEVLHNGDIDKLKNEDLIDDYESDLIGERQLDDQQSVMRK